MRLLLFLVAILSSNLFGESETQTEILLKSVDYEPYVEDMEAEIHIEDGEAVFQSANGKEVDDTYFEELAVKVREQISKEQKVISFQQKAILNLVRTILSAKGINFESAGTKIIIKDELSPEDISNITNNFFFVENIQKATKEIPTSTTHKTVAQARKDTLIDPYGNGRFNASTDDVDIGVLLKEANGNCVDTSAKDSNGNRFISTSRYSFEPSASHFHATLVAHILQKASKFTHLLCVKDYNVSVDDYFPRPYISNHSYTKSKSQESKNYIEADAQLDDFIYRTKIASFVATGNVKRGKNVGSPGKAFNAITVAQYNSSTKDYSHIVYGDPNTGAVKPELIANGFFDFGGKGDYSTQSGSSYATPFVASGFGANLLHQFPYLKNQPQSLKAFLLAMATTTEPIIPHEHEGAGEIDSYLNMLNARISYWNLSSYNPALSKHRIFNKSYTLLAKTKYKISASWLAKRLLNKAKSIDEIYPRFSVKVYDSSGKEIAKSSEIDDNSNFELFEFTTDKAEKYKFSIIQSIPINELSKKYKGIDFPISTLYLSLVVKSVK